MKKWFHRTVYLGIAIFLALVFTPVPAGLRSVPAPSAEFVDRDGKLLRTLLAEETRFSRECALFDISPHLVAATLAAEDKRFRYHPGIDPIAVLRALKDGGQRSGASTITQQLVKLAALEKRRRNVRTKLLEMWLALRVELTWSKDEILAAYLNRLDYGNLNIGVATASRAYFGKPPADLSLAEAALLAGLPKAPSKLDPYQNLSGAMARQAWVIERMRAQGELEQFSEAILLLPEGNSFEAPHFVDLLLHRKGILPEKGGGVATTLDLGLNRFVEKALATHLGELGGAAVVIENATGDVLALASSGTGEVNLAWEPRSPGSAMKPFTYLRALEAGAEPATIVADVPTRFPTPTGVYAPNNYNHRFYGPVSLRFSLANSLNVGAIRALQLAGGSEVLHRTMRDLGITTFGHPAEYYGLGLTLGNGEVRLLELTNAYATLGRLGIYRPYRLRKGRGVAPGVRVAEQAATYLIADILCDDIARSASFGRDSYLAFDFPVACKTGTSSDYRDAWTMATTPVVSVGVWVGNADGSPMRKVTGLGGAAPIMHAIMQELVTRYGTPEFERPAIITEHRINPLSGGRDPDGISELFARLPEKIHDVGSPVQLPPEYSAWIASSQNRLGDLVVPTRGAGTPVISAPAPGTQFFLDSDLPEASQRIPLNASGVARIQWASPSLLIENGTAQLIEGKHTLTATNPETGETAKTWIEVGRW